jgi:hypothetical protein
MPPTPRDADDLKSDFLLNFASALTTEANCGGSWQVNRFEVERIATSFGLRIKDLGEGGREWPTIQMHIINITKVNVAIKLMPAESCAYAEAAFGSNGNVSPRLMEPTN